MQCHIVELAVDGVSGAAGEPVGPAPVAHAASANFCRSRTSHWPWGIAERRQGVSRGVSQALRHTRQAGAMIPREAVSYAWRAEAAKGLPVRGRAAPTAVFSWPDLVAAGRPRNGEAPAFFP